MMKLGKITIAAVGKIKTSHWKSAQTDYIKRLKRYTTISLLEVRDFVGKGFPDSVAVVKEGYALLDMTKNAKYRIALTIQGQSMDSEKLAAMLLRWVENYGEIAFILGGPVGVSPDIIQRCQFELSLSSFTLPHELARVVLLEQLYRAATIINKQAYHK